jgi:hypothetical protein
MDITKDTKEISIKKSLYSTITNILSILSVFVCAMCMFAVLIMSFVFLVAPIDEIFLGHVKDVTTVTVSEYKFNSCDHGNVYVIGQVNDETMYIQTCNINNACLESDIVKSDFHMGSEIPVFFAGTGQGCYTVKDYNAAVSNYYNTIYYYYIMIVYIIVFMWANCHK